MNKHVYKQISVPDGLCWEYGVNSEWEHALLVVDVLDRQTSELQNSCTFKVARIVEEGTTPNRYKLRILDDAVPDIRTACHEAGLHRRSFETREEAKKALESVVFTANMSSLLGPPAIGFDS